MLEQFVPQPGLDRRRSRLAFALALGAALCVVPGCRSAFPSGALDPQTTNTAAGDGGWPTPPQPPTDESSDASALHMPARESAAHEPAAEKPVANEHATDEPADDEPAAENSAAEKSAAEKSTVEALEAATHADQPAPRTDVPADPRTDAELTKGEQVEAPTALPDEAQVGQLLERYYHDFATGEWTGLRQHFWPDATLVTIRSPGLGAPPAVVVMSIGDYIARHANGGGRGSTLRIELEPPRIESFGSIASAIAHYRANDSSGQEAQSWSGADLFSFVRHEGQWRIASLVFEGARFGAK